MEKNKGIFSSLLKLITYTEKQQPQEFIIPEVDSAENNKESSGSEASSAPQNTDGSYGKKSSTQNLKKPMTVEELKNNKEGTKKASPKADINTISTEIKANADFINSKFNFPENKDIVVREFVTSEAYKSFVAYIDGMADKSTINDFILRPLMILKMEDKLENQTNQCILDFVHDYILEINQTKKIFDHKEAVSEILMGNTILCIDGCDFYISCETKGFDKRGVEKPVTEGVVKGPHTGLQRES